MKRLLLSIAVIAALVLSQTAWADSRHYRGFYGSNYSRGYNSYHYGYRGGNYFRYSYNNHYYNRHHGHGSGSFLGGLVLGSLLSYPRYSSRNYGTVTYSSRPVIRTREVVYVNNSTARNSTSVTTGRRLLRDLEGNCFERIIDDEGNEIRVQLDPSECSF